MYVYYEICEEVFEILTDFFADGVDAFTQLRSQNEVIPLFEISWNYFTHIFPPDRLEDFIDN